jgi:hypothetical protein
MLAALRSTQASESLVASAVRIARMTENTEPTTSTIFHINARKAAEINNVITHTIQSTTISWEDMVSERISSGGGHTRNGRNSLQGIYPSRYYQS